MPRPRVSAAPPLTQARKSPRKRRLVDEDADERIPLQTGLSNSSAGEKGSLKRTRTKPTTNEDESSALPTAIDTLPNPKTKSIVATSKVQPDKGSGASKLKGKTSNKSNSAVKVKELVEVEVDEEKNEILASSTEIVVKQDDPDVDDKPTKTIRKRKTKEEKEAEAMPLAARTSGVKMFVGAHVSIAKGLENAITNAMHIGGNAFALFLKSQRKWENPSLKDSNRDAFLHQCKHHHYDQSSHVVPHGSYLVNLASPDADMSKKSYDAFVDDLHRCEALGIKHYNFHPGSTNKESMNEAIGRLAANLNRALAETETVTPLLENMAGHGSIIGSRFSDLRDIIVAIKPEFKSRIGICIDTCHAFAAGYDLRTPDAFKKTFKELDDTVGLKYLKAMHINDSKAPFDSHRDLHQNIGAGFLGLRAFHNVMNDERLQNIPLILETPCEKPDPENPKKTIDDKTVWSREIKLLESLIGMDPESEEFKRLEADLSAQGKAERDKMEASIAVRDEKARKKAQKELEKGQKSISTMFGAKGRKRKESVSSSSSLSDADSNV